MKRMALLLILAVVASMCVAGCASDFPLKWKPTEQQKQAADLTVKDLQAMRPHVAPEAEIIRREAQQSAEITQTYMGLPMKRPWPASPQNQPMLQQADQDANRPPPTVRQAVEATTAAGFDLVDVVLTAAGSIASVWGLGKARSKINGWRTGAANAETKVNETTQAITEIVRSIDHLAPETKRIVKAAMHQSPETQQLVSEVKRQ